MTDLEFSPSVIWKDPQESGGVSVWPLKYWTTASPVLLLTVVTWNVRPCFLLTYLLLESKLSERRVWPLLLLVKFLIPQDDDSAVQCGSEVEFETKFATSSQPPGMKRASHFQTVFSHAATCTFRIPRWIFSTPLISSCYRQLQFSVFFSSHSLAHRSQLSCRFQLFTLLFLWSLV